MVTPTEVRLERRKEQVRKIVNFGKYLRTRRKY